MEAPMTPKGSEVRLNEGATRLLLREETFL